MESIMIGGLAAKYLLPVAGVTAGTIIGWRRLNAKQKKEKEDARLLS